MNRVNSYRSIRVAKYIRLSRDDGDDRESESVENQRDIIDNYIQEHEDLKVIGEYADDGFTGTNFNRPGFQEMLKIAIRLALMYQHCHLLRCIELL